MSGLELHEAASTGDLDSLEEFIESEKFDINLQDEEWKNKTPLHWAAEKGFVQCVRVLLDHGADGTRCMDMDWTPAHCAAEAGKLQVLRTLYDDYNIPVNLPDKYGDTPRRLAEIYGHTDCVNYLKQAEMEKKSGKNTESRGRVEEEKSSEEEQEQQQEEEEQEINYKHRRRVSIKLSHKT